MNNQGSNNQDINLSELPEPTAQTLEGMSEGNNESLEASKPEGPVEAEEQHVVLKRSMVRYLIVGFSSFAIELALFYLLHFVLNIDVVISNVIAIFISASYNFTMSRKWTFNSVTSLPRSIVLYLLLFVWNQFFSSWAIVSLVGLGFHAMIAKIFTMALIVCWNFVLYRKLVFK